jgi:hypothetical protein
MSFPTWSNENLARQLADVEVDAAKEKARSRPGGNYKPSVPQHIPDGHLGSTIGSTGKRELFKGIPENKFAKLAP